MHQFMNKRKSAIFTIFAQWLLVAVTLFAGQGALAQSGAQSCGDLATHYGPYDYRTDRDKLGVVEHGHFTPEVEALIRGKTSMFIGADLAYVLGTFPNHHRALMSMMRLGKKLNTPQPPHAAYSVECYFQRALRFRPDDTVARMMYANYLQENARFPEAKRELEQVEKIADDNFFTYYNAGLIYLDIKEYDKALAMAHKAMALGFEKRGLRDELIALGKWQEPKKSPDPAAAAEDAIAPPNK